MIKLLCKFIFRKYFEKYQKNIEELNTLLDAYRKKEKIEKYANYITISFPKSKEDLTAFNSYLSGLGKSEQFKFYLHTIENEILYNFVNGKGEDIYRGGLRVIQKIRIDIRDAEKSEGKTNADKAI
jgi:hypothetical protein